MIMLSLQYNLEFNVSLSTLTHILKSENCTPFISMQCANAHLNFEVSSVEDTTLATILPSYVHKLDLFQDFLQFLFFFYSIDKQYIVVVL